MLGEEELARNLTLLELLNIYFYVRHYMYFVEPRVLNEMRVNT